VVLSRVGAGTIWGQKRIKDEFIGAGDGHLRKHLQADPGPDGRGKGVCFEFMNCRAGVQPEL